MRKTDQTWELCLEAISDGIEFQATSELDLSSQKKLKSLDALIKTFQNVGFQNHDEKPAFQWGHLNVLEVLGEGGYGTVYRAIDPILDRVVALKLKKVNGDVSEPSFVNEARRLAQIRHPNVVGIYGGAVHDNQAGIWCDFIDGENLAERVQKEGPLPFQDILEVGLAISSALSLIHQKNLIHGDLKGGNVMQAYDGQILLMDFGASLEKNAAGKVFPLRGTPHYLAPEILEGEGADEKADIFSFGILIYFLATADKPQNGNVFPLGKDLARIIKPCLNSNPEERPNAEWIHRQLRRLKNKPMRRRKQLKWALLGMVLTLAAIVSTLGWIHANRNREEAFRASQETEAVNAFLENLFISPRAVVSGRKITVIEFLEQTSEQLFAEGGNQAHHARSHAILANTFRQLNKLDLAERHSQKSLDLNVQIFGENSKQALMQQAQLYHLQLDMGHFDTYEQHGEQFHSDALSTLSHEGQSLVHIIRARYLRNTKRIQEAKQEFELILTLKEGEARWWFFEAKKALAEIYVDERNLVEAETLMQDCLKWAEESNKLGYSIKYKGILSNIFALQNKHHASEMVIRSTLKDANALYGDQSLETLLPLFSLGISLYQQKRYDEAGPIYQDCYQMAAKHHGANHPISLTVLNNQAINAMEMGNYSEAEVFIKKAISGFEKSAFADSNNAHFARLNLCELHLKQGLFQACIQQASENEAHFNHLPEDSYVMLYHSFLISSAYFELGEHQKTIEILSPIQKHLREKFSDQVWAIQSEVVLGKALHLSGSAEARNILQRALKNQLFPESDRSQLKEWLEKSGAE